MRTRVCGGQSGVWCGVPFRLGAWLAGLVGVVCLCGCAADNTQQQQDPERSEATYGELVERYNARLEHITQLGSGVTPRYEYVDEGGQRRVFEGLTGRFDYIAPDRLSVVIRKVGQRAARIGRDEHRYWFISLESGEERAFVGRVGSGGIASGGLYGSGGLHGVPSEMIGLLALDPIDQDAPGRVEPGADGSVWLVLERASGLERWVEMTGGPGGVVRRVELRDAEGRTVARSELEGRIRVERADLGERPVLAKHVTIRPTDGSWELALMFGSADNSATDPSSGAYDFDRLVDAYGIGPDRVVDLDAQDRGVADGGGR